MKLMCTGLCLLAVLACEATEPISQEPPLTLDGGDGGASSSSVSSTSSSSASSGTGGSGGTPQTPGDGSGARLRRRMYTSADGLLGEVNSIFFDTVLKEECVPRRTPMGFRCAPVVQAAAITKPYYADAACTIPAAMAFVGCAAPTHAVVTSNATCAYDMEYRVYAMGEKVPTVYALSGASCSAVTVQGYDAYAVGPEVNYSTLATIAIETE